MPVLLTLFGVVILGGAFYAGRQYENNQHNSKHLDERELDALAKVVKNKIKDDEL